MVDCLHICPLILQGDVLITKCTYNTEDRTKPTVVSSNTLLMLSDITRIPGNNSGIATSTFLSYLLPSFSFKLHIFLLYLLSLLCIPLSALCATYLCLLREVSASWRKCASTTFTTTLVLSWSCARATLIKDTCRNTLTSLTGKCRCTFPTP